MAERTFVWLCVRVHTCVQAPARLMKSIGRLFQHAPVYFTDPKLASIDMCTLCHTAGVEPTDFMLPCDTCMESFHLTCLDCVFPRAYRHKWQFNMTKFRCLKRPVIVLDSPPPLRMSMSSS